MSIKATCFYQLMQIPLLSAKKVFPGYSANMCRKLLPKTVHTLHYTTLHCGFKNTRHNEGTVMHVTLKTSIRKNTFKWSSPKTPNFGSDSKIFEGDLAASSNRSGCLFQHYKTLWKDPTCGDIEPRFMTDVFPGRVGHNTAVDAFILLGHL